MSVIGIVHIAAFSRFFFSSFSTFCLSAIIKTFSKLSIALSWSEKSGANPSPSTTSPFAILLLRSWISASDMISRCCSFSMRSVCLAIYSETLTFASNRAAPALAPFLLYPAFMNACVALPPFLIYSSANIFHFSLILLFIHLSPYTSI